MDMPSDPTVSLDLEASVSCSSRLTGSPRLFLTSIERLVMEEDASIDVIARLVCYSWWWLFALIGSADLASYQTDHPAAEEAGNRSY